MIMIPFLNKFGISASYMWLVYMKCQQSDQICRKNSPKRSDVLIFCLGLCPFSVVDWFYLKEIISAFHNYQLPCSDHLAMFTCADLTHGSDSNQCADCIVSKYIILSS